MQHTTAKALIGALALGCCLGVPAPVVSSELGLTPSRDVTLEQRLRQGDFDAQAEIACAQERGEALGSCVLGVVRGPDGTAVAQARFPNGFARKLYFGSDGFQRADTTMSGNGTDTDWAVTAGVFEIRVDDQRYVVPVALITGD